MAAYADSLVERLLVERGFHPAGAWWTQVIDRFDASGVRALWLRVGRRGGKTVHALRWAIRESIEKHWNVDPGDVGIIPIVSARRGQAVD